MTENRRIFLNIVATYGRSLYALIIGLFCGRWTLMALGEVDYGLMGVVGGLTMFISFFNNILAGSISRFYAFSVGKAVADPKAGLEECRRWFSVAVSIHTTIPLVLMIVGAPVGVWAIEHYLTIPPDRVGDCLKVFRYVCLTCFLGMVSVPFNAMYTAKQYIAELTIYSFVTSTLNVVFLYYMIHHPGVWLAPYALWSCVLTIVPSLIIVVRACVIFPECRLRVRSLFNLADIRELFAFAGWSFFGALGNLLKGAGMTVLVNKMLGPTFNATVTIANTVSSQTQTLAAAMVGAFMPAITTARGAGNRERMITLVHTTCKFGALLVLPLAIPLSLEVEEVLVLWLKTPPQQVGCLCIWLMAILLLEKVTTGHWVVIAANGKIAWYQFIVGTLFILTLPLAWGMMKVGLGIYSVGYALFSTLAAVAVVRLIAVKVLLDISPRYWIFRIFLPLVGVGGVAVSVGLLPRLFFPPSFLRLCITTGVTEVVLIPLVLFTVLDAAERKFLKEKFSAAIVKVLR